jgi:hypothetical protein
VPGVLGVRDRRFGVTRAGRPVAAEDLRARQLLVDLGEQPRVVARLGERLPEMSCGRFHVVFDPPEQAQRAGANRPGGQPLDRASEEVCAASPVAGGVEVDGRRHRPPRAVVALRVRRQPLGVRCELSGRVRMAELGRALRGLFELARDCLVGDVCAACQMQRAFLGIDDDGRELPVDVSLPLRGCERVDDRAEERV